MTIVSFHRHVQGHKRNIDRQALQWRELMAITYNLNRGEKNKALSGKDFWALAIDDQAQANKTAPKYKKITAKKRAWLTAIMNQSAQPTDT